MDQARSEQFGERMVGVLNSAGLALMTSLGHRSGLFDSLAGMPPATSQQIADATGLNERYVREWLGAMVSSEVIEHDEATRTYKLPPEHAAFLTRSASPANVASSMQWFAVLGQVEDRILECFRHGGGVHYSAFNRFHEVMAEESDQTVGAALVEHILPLASGVPEALARGIDVVDVGCGSGRSLLRMAEAFPKSRFAGYDFSEQAIEAGRAEAARRGLKNVRFEIKDAARIGESQAYDLITAFDAIHDQADPVKVLDQISAALRPGGTFLMQDISASSHVKKNIEHPVGTLLYAISCMHCMTVSLAQGGAGLGACWGQELARQMLVDAGFNRVEVHQLPHDFINSYFVARKQ